MIAYEPRQERSDELEELRWQEARERKLQQALLRGAVDNMDNDDD